MYKSTLYLILCVFAFAPLSLCAQIEVLSPLEYFIDFEEDVKQWHVIDVRNNSDEAVSFKWSLDYNFEHSVDFHADISDFNLHWHFNVLSSCGLALPSNELLPGETRSLSIGIIKSDLYTNDPNEFPEIKFNLMSAPDCDSIINTIVFKGMITSTSFEEIDDTRFFPNPADDVVFVNNMELENVYYQIVNTVGQFVQKGTIVNQQLNVAQLDSGIYILLINIGDQPKVWRFVK